MNDYRSISRTEDGVNLNALAVYDSFDRITAGFATSSQDLTYSRILSYQRDALIAILKKVEESERQFYSITGIGSLTTFQEEIEKINEEEGLSILTNARFGEIMAYLRMAGFNFKATRADAQTLLIEQAFNKAFNENPEFEALILNYAQEKTEEAFLAIFNSLGEKQFLSTEAINKLPQEFIDQMGGKEKAGLFKSIKLNINLKTHKLYIDWENASNKMIKKLHSIILSKFPEGELKEIPDDKQSIIQTLRQIIEEHHLIKNGKYRNLVLQEMTDSALIASYDVNRSQSSLLGYLGEVHLNVLLKGLFGNKGVNVKNTGNIRDDLRKQEIGIDALLNNFGFQVKNYSIIDDRLAFEKTKGYNRSMDALFKRIMGVMPMHYDQLMAELYGTAQFNKPYARGTDSGDIYADFYDNRLMPFVQNQGLEYFRYSIDRIMRIDQTFSSQADSLFADQQLYFNTFFFINGRIVPSSAVIKTIIRTIDKKVSDSSYKFMMQVNYSDVPNYYQSVVEPRNNGDEPRVPSLFGDNGILSKINVKIEYSFDLAAILAEAIQSLT